MRPAGAAGVGTQVDRRRSQHQRGRFIQGLDHDSGRAGRPKAVQPVSSIASARPAAPREPRPLRLYRRDLDPAWGGRAAEPRCRRLAAGRRMKLVTFQQLAGSDDMAITRPTDRAASGFARPFIGALVTAQRWSALASVYARRRLETARPSRSTRHRRNARPNGRAYSRERAAPTVRSSCPDAARAPASAPPLASSRKYRLVNSGWRSARQIRPRSSVRPRLRRFEIGDRHWMSMMGWPLPLDRCRADMIDAQGKRANAWRIAPALMANCAAQSATSRKW